MYGCQQCQEQLLDHLYGLLGEAEQIELLAHLDACPQCSQALATAQDQQRLLAVAAKRSFPEVSFGPPTTTTAIQTTPRPTVLPRAASQTSVGRWYALASLAAMLLLSVGGWQVWYLRGAQQAQREQVARLLETARDRFQQEEAAQKRQVEDLVRGFNQEQQQIHAQADSQQLRLVVTGPRHLSPGATAEYTVKTFDRRGQPLDALVMVEVDRSASRGAQEKLGKQENPSSRPESIGGKGGGFSGSVGGVLPSPTLPPVMPMPGAPSGPKETRPGGLPALGPASGALGGNPGGTGGVEPPSIAAPSPGGGGISGNTPPHRGSLPTAPMGKAKPGDGRPGRDLSAKDNSDKNDRPNPPLKPVNGVGQDRQGNQLPGEAAGSDSKTDGAGDERKDTHREALPLKKVGPGTYTLTLPPDVVPQGRQLAMNVRARPVDAQSEREELAVQGKVTLSAPVYLTQLTTDKPLYRPGETVHFRSLTLDRATHTPFPEPALLNYVLVSPTGEQRLVGSGVNRLTNQKGKPMRGPDGKPIRGLGVGQFALPTDAPGGVYTLKLSSEHAGISETTRPFLVQEYRASQLEKKLDFNRGSYGPGDEVQAEAQARRANGGPLADCPVTATLTVDGTSLPVVKTKTNAAGRAVVRFTLPGTIQRGDATLAVNFADAGTPETISRPVPVVVNRVQMEFYPEGGDLVVGLPSRVYFQARTPLGRPADVRGTLLENGKPTDIHFSTVTDAEQPGANQGLGLFAFTPRPGARYSVRLDSPRGITTHYPLPSPRAEGVTLRVEGGVFAANDAIRVQIHSDRPRELLVGVYGRDTLLDSQILPAGQSDVVLRPGRSASQGGGVCRVTAFEYHVAGGSQRVLHPVAERLIYRQPAERLDVKLQADKPAYSPTDRVHLRMSTRNAQGEPMPAIAQVAVVDQNVLTLAAERNQPTLPTYFLLTSEVRRAEDLEHADFLLGSHPRAPVVLDLLLGTQGWRRFAAHPGKRKDLERLADGKDQTDPASNRFLDLLAERTSRELTSLQQRTRELADRYADRGVALIETLRQKREEQLSQLQEAQAEAQAAAELQYARWKGLRDGSALTAGILAVLLLLISLGIKTRGPLLLLSFALSSMTLILVSLVPLDPPEPLDENEAAQALPETLPADPKADSLREAESLVEDLVDLFQVQPKGTQGERFRPIERERDLRWNTAEAGKSQLSPITTLGTDHTASRLKRPFGVGGNRFRLLPGMPGAPRDVDRLPGGYLGAEIVNPILHSEMVVREYAHVRPADLKPDIRADFTETVYWHPVLVLPNGESEISFQLPDSATRFNVTAFVHTLDGHLAAATTHLESRLPVNVAPKLPTEISASDALRVPVSANNTTDEPRKTTLKVTKHDGLKLERTTAELDLPARAARRVLLDMRPSIAEGTATLELQAEGDAVRHTLRVVPEGFPVTRSWGGLLEKSATHSVSLPGDVIPGSLKVRVDAYPSPLSELSRGLEGILREPNGCFEQTSSSNYPNVMTLSFLRGLNRSSPATESRARALLDSGYKRLVSFECESPTRGKREGFDWFGGANPPHEGLTAYGLLQFHDMARVSSVEPELLARTRGFLLGRRDGAGGFLRHPQAKQSFGTTTPLIGDAYITWALSETGDDPLKAELAALTQATARDDDAYLLALVSLSLLNRDRKAEALPLLKRLAAQQDKDGALSAATSITSSGGVDLQVETTALATIAWLRADRTFTPAVEKAIRWLARQRQGSGHFGSTQATILALKAFLTHAERSARTIKAGRLTVYHGTNVVGTATIPEGAEEPIALELAQLDKVLPIGGTTELRVVMDPPSNVMPVTLSADYRVRKPDSAEKPLVGLKTTLEKAQITEGDMVRLQVRVENRSGQDQGMVTAIVGLPAGLTIPTDMEQLRKLCRRPEDGTEPPLSAVEIRGRELILYWRGMRKDQAIEVPVDLIAQIPGTYRGPASRAYVYYNATTKTWIEPLSVTIQAR